jgi:hypothetical protein
MAFNRVWKMRPTWNIKTELFMGHNPDRLGPQCHGGVISVHSLLDKQSDHSRLFPPRTNTDATGGLKQSLCHRF